MKKLLFIVLGLLSIKATAQQTLTDKSLPGRWEMHFKAYTTKTEYKTYTITIQFDGEGSMMFLSPGGMILSKAIYSYEVKNDVIKIKYTTDIEKKEKRKYLFFDMKVLNDSLLIAHKKMQADADTNTKGVSAYRKIKNTERLPVRLPNNKDLFGKWFSTARKSTSPVISFVDSSRVVFTKNGKDYEASYNIDFNRQPARVVFTALNTGKMFNALLKFVSESEINFQLFKEESNDNHFTTLHKMYLERR